MRSRSHLEVGTADRPPSIGALPSSERRLVASGTIVVRRPARDASATAGSPGGEICCTAATKKCAARSPGKSRCWDTRRRPKPSAGSRASPRPRSRRRSSGCMRRTPCYCIRARCGPGWCIPSRWRRDRAGSPLPQKGYWANCLYCGLGIAAALRSDAEITTRYGGEGEAVVYRVRQGELVEPAGVFHLSTPVARWWDNVIFACSSFQPLSRRSRRRRLVRPSRPAARRDHEPAAAVGASPPSGMAATSRSLGANAPPKALPSSSSGTACVGPSGRRSADGAWEPKRISPKVFAPRHGPRSSGAGRRQRQRAGMADLGRASAAISRPRRAPWRNRGRLPGLEKFGNGLWARAIRRSSSAPASFSRCTARARTR